VSQGNCNLRIDTLQSILQKIMLFVEMHCILPAESKLWCAYPALYLVTRSMFQHCISMCCCADAAAVAAWVYCCRP
jgi:hypothetical protein